MILAVFKRLINSLFNLKIKFKILFSFFCLILIIFSFFTYFVNFEVSRTIANLVEFSTLHSFKLSHSYLTYRLEEIKYVANVIMADDSFASLLSKDPDMMDIHSQIGVMQTLTANITPFENSEEIDSIRLYINDKFFFISEERNYHGYQSIQDAEWYHRLIVGRGNSLWIPSNNLLSFNKNDPDASNDSDSDASTDSITLVRSIIDPNDYSHLVGLLRIDINKMIIQDILVKSLSLDSGATVILNSQGDIIASSDKENNQHFPFDFDTLSFLTKQSLFFDTIDFENEKYLLACQYIENSDWLLVSSTPYDGIVSASNKIKNKLLLLFLATILFVYLLSFLIADTLTKSLRELTKKIKTLKKGNFDVNISYNNKDEIGELIESFNDMAKRIERLIDEQFHLGQEAKNNELLALQAQIKPHFLCNTLDLINWAAISYKTPEISEIVQSLSKFYKLSLSRGLNIISIKDEIEHVKMYIDIERRRFESAFRFECNIDESVYKFSTLKVILQPLVENSIHHGILQKPNHYGTIKLKAHHYDNDIYFIVEDDGIGMTSSDIENLTSDNKERLSGYGIKNVIERIKLHYGDDYGLSFKSEYGEGLRVEVKIPAILHK